MVRQNGRTPLIVSAFENPASTDDIRQCMDLADPKRENHLYLRSLGLELEHAGYEHIVPIKDGLLNEYEEELHNHQAKWFLTINFDEDDPEAEIPWKYLYDPDLDRLLRGKDGFPDEIWCGNKSYFGSGPSTAHPVV
jgi:hypothetical protein